MQRVLVCLALAYVAQGRLIAVGFRNYDSGFASLDGLDVQPVQQYNSLETGSADNLYSQSPQQFQSAWASQQLHLLNSLQSFMLAPPVSRCGGHAKVRELQTPSVSSSMSPLVVSYLASARLGSLPTAFDGFSQALQEEAAAQEAVDQVQNNEELSSSYTVADLVNEALMDSLVGATDLDAQPEQLQARQGPFSEEEARSVMASTMSNVVPDDSAQQAAATGFRDFVLESKTRNVNWGMVFFIVQCVACAAVWLRLMYVWCSLGASCMPKEQAQFMTLAADDMQSPLLAPLQQDGPTGVIKSYTKTVEVASEHVPEGVEYVSIAYVPLKGEGEA